MKLSKKGNLFGRDPKNTLCILRFFVAGFPQAKRFNRIQCDFVALEGE
jgi:hypothetical protein